VLRDKEELSVSLCVFILPFKDTDKLPQVVALSLQGTIANGDQRDVTITNNDAANSGAGRRWNLIANPFASLS
jgi:hypothetical protein